MCLAYTPIEVILSSQFPFQRPLVRPICEAQARGLDASGLSAAPDGVSYQPADSWHRDIGGGLCLYSDDDQARLPWADGWAFLEQVSAWMVADQAGWAGDRPDMDFDRYIESSQDGWIVLYDDTITTHIGKRMNLSRKKNASRRLQREAATRRGPGRSRVWEPESVLVVNVGNLTAPIRNWSGLLAAIEPDQEAQLKHAVDNELPLVALLYQRAGATGLLMLRLLATEETVSFAGSPPPQTPT